MSASVIQQIGIDSSPGWKQTFVSELLSGLKGEAISADPAPLFPEFVDDPVGFVNRIILPYFPGEEIIPSQADVLEALVEHDRVAVRKGNGVGATTVAAWANSPVGSPDWYEVVATGKVELGPEIPEPATLALLGALAPLALRKRRKRSTT